MANNFYQPNQYAQSYNNYQIPQQQQMFPTSQGSVYTINNTLEVANVPASSGLTVALCLNEGLMYIKSIQNGTPMFWSYRMVPYVEEKKNSGEIEDRLRVIEEKLNLIDKKKEVGF